MAFSGSLSGRTSRFWQFLCFVTALQSFADLTKGLDLDTYLRFMAAPVTTEVLVSGHAYDLISKNLLGEIPLEEKDHHLVKELFRQSQSLNLRMKSEISSSDFRNIVRFVKGVRQGLLSRQWPSGADLYVYPESPDKEGLRWPLHLMENGHCYIHFESSDPRYKKGSYKKFSRSMDCDSGKIWAHLNMDMNLQKAQKSLSELRVMASFKGCCSHALGFRELALSSLCRSGQTADEHDEHDESTAVINWKLSLITPLFEDDLERYMHHPLTLYQQIELASAVATALHHLHQQHQVIHMDLKPANIFIRKNAQEAGLVLGDFGLSEVFSSWSFGRRLSGSRGYMAPEMCGRWVDGSLAMESFEDGVLADTFSLGMTLYSLLKGQEHPLKEYARNMNRVALPKGGKRLAVHSRKDFTRSLDDYKQEYVRQKPLCQQKDQPESCFRYEYELCLWQLLNPAAESRLSLEQFIDKLAALKGKRDTLEPI